MFSRAAGHRALLSNRILGPKLRSFSALPAVLGPFTSAPYISRREIPKEKPWVCIGGPSMLANIMKEKEASLSAENVIYIGEDSWIMSCHTDWDHLPWGQTTRYLPPYLLDIAKKAFPDYPETELMTFGMVKYIFREQKRQAQEFLGSNYHEGHMEWLKAHPQGGLAACINGKKLLLVIDDDYHIINAGRVDNQTPHLLALDAGLLYQQPREKSEEPLVIVGSGLTLDWTCRDFVSYRPIIHLIPPGDRSRADLKDYLHSAIQLDDNETLITKHSDGTNTIEGKDIHTGKYIRVRVQESLAFSAMGKQHDESLVNVDPNNITHIDGSPQKSAIQTYLQCTSGNYVLKASDFRGTSTPDGNLALNYLLIAARLGRYDPNESNAILLFDEWQRRVTEQAISVGVTIKDSYFESLMSSVKNAYTLSVPDAKQLSDIIERHYSNYSRTNEVENRVIDRDGQELSWEGFKEMLAVTKQIVDELPIHGLESSIENIDEKGATPKTG